MVVDASEGKFPEKTAEALQPLIKLITLANAGGVASTVAIIGATAKSAGIVNILAMPLGFFALGVCLSVLYAMSYFLRIAEHDGWETAPKCLSHGWFMRVTGYGAIVLFISGCLCGVLIVACA